MILLDTHVWVWLVTGDARLGRPLQEQLRRAQAAGLGVSVISCWEVAKLVQLGRLRLGLPIGTWLSAALAWPGVRLIDLTPHIALESTQLPGVFHRDPADQLITATARVLRMPLATLDAKLRAYPHVQILP